MITVEICIMPFNNEVPIMSHEKTTFEAVGVNHSYDQMSSFNAGCWSYQLPRDFLDLDYALKT